MPQLKKKTVKLHKPKTSNEGQGTYVKKEAKNCRLSSKTASKHYTNQLNAFFKLAKKNKTNIEDTESG